MFFTILKRWLPLAFLATVMCGLVYIAVQQSLRQGANDPQIQMAEDASASLAAGATPQDVVPVNSVNISQSLSPYLVIYDDQGHPILGNGMIAGMLPNLPAGVFRYASATGEDRVTWQTAAGIRSAVVVTKLNGAWSGFVMAGRSLREVEKREDQVGREVYAAWVFSLLALLFFEVLFVLIEMEAGQPHPLSRKKK